jgi:hypothetical protein
VSVVDIPVGPLVGFAVTLTVGAPAFIAVAVTTALPALVPNAFVHEREKVFVPAGIPVTS